MAKISVIIYSLKVEESVHFYEKLGFELMDKIGDFDWVSMHFDSVRLMISKPNAHLSFERAQFTGSIYIEVSNANSLWDKVNSWATIEYPIEDFPYGMREFAIRDLNGYLIQFGESLEKSCNAEVVGIGGIFLASEHPKTLYKWYEDHLGLSLDEYGTVFIGSTSESNPTYLQWSILPNDSSQFQPSTKQFMINYRVNNLTAFIESLKNKGIEVIKMEEQPYGLFAHLLDPEGNKIELWEPIPNAFNEIIGARMYDR